MAHNFNDEDKQVREFKESMPFGVNKVQLTGAIAETSDNGKDYIEVGVVNADGVEDSARCYFVGGASNISFNTLRDIVVHQGKDEEEKAKLRDRVDAVKNSDELAEIVNEFIGGELWLTKYYDPSRTYTTKNGTFRSINKNVLGYEPKLKPELMPQPKTESTPFGEATTATDASSTVPSDDNWAK